MGALDTVFWLFKAFVLVAFLPIALTLRRLHPDASPEAAAGLGLIFLLLATTLAAGVLLSYLAAFTLIYRHESQRTVED